MLPRDRDRAAHLVVARRVLARSIAELRERWARSLVVTPLRRLGPHLDGLLPDAERPGPSGARARVGANSLGEPVPGGSVSRLSAPRRRLRSALVLRGGRQSRHLAQSACPLAP